MTDTLISGRAAADAALTAEQLGADSITVSVKCSDPSIRVFRLNEPVVYSYRGSQRGTYYLQSIDRVGPDRYQLYGLSAVSLLTQRPHAGGIYTGETAERVIQSICGDLPVRVESVFAGVKLYGWLPYVKPPQSSARDNLAQVLFALGAHLSTDLNGTLRVEKLWDVPVSVIDRDRIYSAGASVEYGSEVSAVNVTEHQWIQGSEEGTTLFDGTAEEGTLVTFSDPAYDLVADGFTIRESGANYAILSAGAGTLTGKPYKHLTRVISRVVTEGAIENEISITDKTLVSLANSVSVVRRLAEYYKATATLKESVVTRQERPGHLVQAYDPHDRKLVQACIESLDMTMSATLKSSMTALVGFKPPQPDGSIVATERLVLTGSGTFEIPDGTIQIHYVLVSGGTGGRCGKKGGDAASGSKFSYTDPKWGDTVDGYALALAGDGGEGGTGGAGGRIVEGDLDAAGLKSLSYVCGSGGIGAAYNTADAAGTAGTDTVLEKISTAGAAAPEAGYTDPITGEQFGGTGESGLPGGKGAGRNPAVSTLTPTEAIRYTGGTYAYDEDGKGYAPGSVSGSGGSVTYYNVETSKSPKSYGWWSDGLGGGPAAGAVGASGSSGRGTAGTSAVTVSGGSGANGRTPTLTPRKPARYGRGGRGGYGGGGASSGGVAMKNGTGTTTAGTGGVGGSGGQGGPGGDGCVVLLLYRKKSIKSGPLVTSGQKWLLDSLGRRIIV